MMNRFRQVSSKLIILTAVPLLVFSAMMLIGMKAINDNNGSAQRVMELRLRQTQSLNSIIRTYTHNIIDSAHKARTGMLIWSEGAQLVTDGRETIKGEWAEYQQAKLSAEETEILKIAEPLFEDSLKTIDKLAGYIDEQSSYSMGNFVDLDLYTALDPLLIQLDKLVQLQKTIAVDEFTANSQSAGQLKRIFMVIMLIVTISVVLLGVSIYRSIERPLKQLQKTMQTVEKDSNLILRINLTSRDEFAAIGESFNRMMERILELVQMLSNTGTDLGHAAENMLIASEDSQTQATNTKDELSIAASAIEQMSHSAENIYASIEQTRSITIDADNNVKSSLESIRLTNEQIKQLADAINQSAEQVDIVREHGQRIDAILTVIKSVAEQTNLLALNAAIEAARAGEQGRGFAVVADEVRSLAQRTQASTKEIETVIVNIRESTEIAATQMYKNAENANDSASAISGSQQSLQQIKQSFSQISDQSNGLSESFSEQTQAISSVNEAVHRIFSLAENSVGTAKNTFDNASKIDTINNELQRALRQFSI